MQMYEEYIHARECLKEAKSWEGIEKKLDRYISIYYAFCDEERDLKKILREEYRKSKSEETFEFYIFHQKEKIISKYSVGLEDEEITGLS